MPTREEALAQLTAPGQPYEFVRAMQGGYEVRVFKNAPPTLGTLFAENRSDLPFFVYDDERYSYEEVYAAACRIGRLLVERYGIGKGDRVAISMRNYPEWVMCFMAVTSIGGIAVALNALWQPEEMEYGLIDSGAKVLFADGERLQRLAACSDAVTVQAIAARQGDGPTYGVAELGDLLRDVPAGPMPQAGVEPTDDAMILYTSGSSGYPKGVVSTHRNVISALLSWELDSQAGRIVGGLVWPEPVDQPATLLAVPLFHATGSHAVYLSSYRAQRKIVSMYKWDAERAAALIERERIDSFIAAPAMTGDLVQAARTTSHDLSSLMLVGGGGAPRAPEQVRAIDQWFANAIPGTGWGMTETNSIGTGIGGAEYLKRPTSSGRAAPVFDLRIVGEDEQPLPAGERGELQIRGTSVCRGYWNRPDANAEAFTDDGWMRTGDVAYLDDEGYLFIVDRIKDLVIRGGENIGCGQVEAAILAHPDALEAAVYAVPDARLGEEVGATVYGRAGLEAEALRAFLGDHLARFEIPRYVALTTEPLPRTASGKIFKREIREAAVAELGADRFAELQQKHFGDRVLPGSSVDLIREAREIRDAQLKDIM